MPNLNVKCYNCGNEFTINRTTYYYRIRLNPNNPKFYCSDCRSVARKNGIKEANDNLSNEEREKKKQENSERARKQWASYNDAKRKEISEIFSKAQKNKIKNMSEKELAVYKKSQSDKAKQESINMSKEEKEAFSKRCSENTKKQWSKYTEEERNDIRKKQSEGIKRYISTLDKVELNKRMDILNQKSIEMWNSLSDDEKELRISTMHEGLQKWRNNLTEEQKQELIYKISESNKEFWKNADDDWKRSIWKKHSDNYWNKSIECREEIVRKTTSWTGNNKLHKHFEDHFKNISNEYNIETDHPISNKNITHCWDYAVFNSNNELVMLIDLDGKYFHADECDYTGVESKEEYDLRRSIPIQNEIKIFILYELKFDECFEYLSSIIDISYDEFIDKRVKEYRSMPFPYPDYTDTELLRSYRDLCKLNCDDKYHKSLNVNTRNGDRLIMHFHRSIWHEHYNEKKSPYEAWNNDKTLYEMVKHGYLYHSYLNKNKILQGFNIYEPTQRVSILSAGKAKMIIHRYLNEYDEIFDPFSGYGGIMIACIAMNKRYIGQDISETHIRESLNMVQFLKDNGINIDLSLSVADSSRTIGTYQCLFANIPSGDEEYQDVDNIYTSDEWIDICLNNYKCNKYIFIVKHTERYADKIVYKINNRYNFIDDYEIILI